MHLGFTGMHVFNGLIFGFAMVLKQTISRQLSGKPDG
jgi:hypothetical protein